IDITQTKQLEERERRQADAMAHQARLTMLGEIASTLAHELNQPLTAIASYNAGVVNSLKRAGVDHAVVYGALQRLGEQAAQAGGRRIALALAKSGERFVRLDVSDNGPGLNGRGVEQLCAPFYSTKSEGMGMGLAICRSILEVHRGAIDAGDAPGGGARFSF